uniref:Uncharacterized protein n=1 Tax=Avena sativa TaxID=4498 RepID=A0ACD5T8S5_AVESA
MEPFKDARSVRLRSHLGTYLCALDDEAVSHGYRRNSRGTVWAVELAGDDYVRLQGHRGLYLGATELPADIPGTRGRGTRASCMVVQGSPSGPNDNAFLWSPLREGDHLTLSGPYGRLLRARFGPTPQDNAVTIDLDAHPEDSSWVVEPVVLPPPPPPAVAPEAAAPLPRARSCDARLEATASEPDKASSFFARFHFHSAKESKGKLILEEEEEEPSSDEEPLWKPAPRTIFYNTARADGGVDDFDEGTWKYFAFNEQSLVALHRRLGVETRRSGGDFVVCRRSAAPPRPLFPVVLDLPPGNADMEFVLVPLVSPAVAESVV